ncbi:MAG: sugar transferase [Patescibacteria group bacterium]|nr:sugar transferase [bacterium]MDZ4221451.1 sugar transferase [Patescibacteria group bacterium]
METARTPDIAVPLPFLKRLFDIAVSVVLLVLFLPIAVLIVLCMAVEAVFCRLNRGPIFYTETRISAGVPFKLRKFRIFKTAAYEPIRARGEIVHTKPLEKNPDNLTGCGKVLKAFYLDELPQLWSVFCGDMTLVGPRPWNPIDYENEIAKGEFRKKAIRAGLTGPVQLHKQDAAEHGGEHKMDYEYIMFVKNKNNAAVVAHDIKLLTQSLWFMLRGQGL